MIFSNTFYSPRLDNAANTAFVAAFEKKYGAQPDTFAMQQYEALMVLDKALASVSGPVDADKIVAGLRAVGTLEAPRGTWRFDDRAQYALSPMYLLRVEDAGGTVGEVVAEDLGAYSPVTGERAT